MEELERCSQEKLVWFLAPTVALCTQQHEVILSQLPAAKTRLLIGSDNVDRWSEKRIWDAALSGVRIVVSTHAVLLDALGHGFVQIMRLALLIFDEAHHCRRKHPANRIMRDFYHPQKLRFGPASVPHILGLTASPVVRSKVRDIDVIEQNLDATCRTPRLQREEMLKFVHRPVMKRLIYKSHNPNTVAPQSTALFLLGRICRTKIPEWDHLTRADQQNTGTPPPAGGYEEQLVKFKRKADHVYEELGPWAADYFILESIKTLSESFNVEPNFLLGFKDAEKTKLLQVLDQIPSLLSSSTLQVEDSIRVSAKVESLILYLADQDPERCSGLVFVKQRATVGVLNALLSRHSQTKDKFRCTTFVGLSNSAKRRYSIAELLDLKAQREALTELRAKFKNLIIATDVLEEGIDVTACNLVVCFDVPSNLKSFLQRRGRARQEQSTFAILLASDGENKDKIPLWQQLEEEMIRLYQDETRLLQNDLSEEGEPAEDVELEINVPSTGAKLSADGAMAHLYHFCALLPPQPYVDLHPAFEVTQDPLTDLFTATVTLPNCISASVRQSKGSNGWKTKKAALKDAAFQAYEALLRAGLLNDHLLPLTHERALAIDKVDKLSAVVEVSGQFDPWCELADAWSSPDLHRTIITLRRDGIDSRDDLQFSLTTPSNIPTINPIKMYWDKCSAFTILLGSPKRIALPAAEALEAMRKATNLIQRSIHSDRNPDRGHDFIALFTPRMENEDVMKWVESNRGRISALDHFRIQPQIPCRGFVRTPSFFGRPYIFQRWCVQDLSPQGSLVEVECVPLPRRRNFLHQATLSKGLLLHSNSPKTGAAASLQAQRFLAQAATIDALPFDQARLGLFIPGILQHLEAYLTAQKLCTTILSSVRFSDLGFVVTALSCPLAQWITNYQRLEFIGDSVLKFVVSRQLFLDRPGWHEGYLSQARANITSNNTLASAAIRTGLDAFVIAEKTHAGPKRYPRVFDVMSGTSSEKRRSLSSKTLADVVEALIGAAYVDDGFYLAGTCINTFLPDIRPFQLSPGGETKPPYDGGINLTNFVVKAEDIIRYQFQNKGLLLEALTHPTCERDIHTESYQRLEFLGDAVLDMLVVSHLANQNASPGEMTRIKAAIVNGNLLGFFCLELSTDEEAVYIEEDKSPGGRGEGVFRSKVRPEQRHLWKYMRFHSQDIALARERSLARYGQLREEIRNALATGSLYPWVALARLDPEKFLSDIIESIIGAIFIDSQGDLQACQRFIECVGIWEYLRRVCAEHVNVEHPRGALERLSGSESVQYAVEFEGDGLVVKSYRCAVSLNEEVLAQAGGCLTKDEAMTVAAETAKKLLVDRRKSSVTVAG